MYPDIRRAIYARMERAKQMEQETHSLPVWSYSSNSRLKPRHHDKNKTIILPSKSRRLQRVAGKRYMDKSRLGMVGLNEEPTKRMTATVSPMGIRIDPILCTLGLYTYKTKNSRWLTWRCLNRSIETHVHVGWPQKTQRTCYDVPSCHITVA